MRPHFERAPSLSRMKLKTKDIEAFMAKLFEPGEGTDTNALGILSRNSDKAAIKAIADKQIESGAIELTDDNIIKLAIIDRQDYLGKYLERFWLNTELYDSNIDKKILTTNGEFTDKEAEAMAGFMIDNNCYSDTLVVILMSQHRADCAKRVYEHFLAHEDVLTFSSKILLFFRYPDMGAFETDDEELPLAHWIARNEASGKDVDRAVELLLSDYKRVFTKGKTTAYEQYDYFVSCVRVNKDVKQKYCEGLIKMLDDCTDETMIGAAVYFAGTCKDKEYYETMLRFAAGKDCAEKLFREAYANEGSDLRPLVVSVAESELGMTEEELSQGMKPVSDEEKEDEPEASLQGPENEQEETEAEAVTEAEPEIAEAEDTKNKPAVRAEKKKYIIKNESEEKTTTMENTKQELTTQESYAESGVSGRYLCSFEVKSADNGIEFWNFRPLAEIRANALYKLMPGDYDYLIPESERKNINLRYGSYGPSRENADKARLMIYNGALLAVDISSEDLEDNKNSQGQRNVTGYRVSCDTLIRKNGLHTPDEIGIYRVVKKKHIRGDIFKDRYIYIDHWEFNRSTPEKIYIDLGEFYAGPYEVRFRVADGEFFVIPDASTKQVMGGFYLKDVSFESLYDGESSGYNGIWSGMDDEEKNEWIVLDERTSKNYVYRDLMTDSDVVETWLKLRGEGFSTDFPFITKVPDDIREKRLNAISNYVTSNEKLKEFDRVMDEAAIKAIFGADNDERIHDYVAEYMNRHQELVSSSQLYQNRVSEVSDLKEKLNDLSQSHEIEINDLKSQVAEAAKEASQVSQLAEEKEELEAVRKEAGELQTKIAALDKDYKEKKQRRDDLIGDTRQVEADFTLHLANLKSKVIGLPFDGFVAAKMAEAAASWVENDEYEKFKGYVKESAEETLAEMTSDEFVQYLVETVQKVRPRYSANEIINIAACISQGFLTVLSGAPGVGKTSICNIIAEVLGLGKEDFTKRYIPVSVEKGWVSKRDFIGYFNPLTGKMDRTNASVFNALKMLDIEKKKNVSRRPYFILLDEANLSPMEYYWSDFMDVCDDEKAPTINLGEDHVYEIPETLRFLATVNNDHTTEAFSPRLLDRAWIITLPRVSSVGDECSGYTAADIKKVSWESIRNTFKGDGKFTTKQRDIFDGLQKRFRTYRNMYISPRAELAVQRYCSAATPHFKDDYGTAPEIVALDYAVAQKVLPKISGQGEQYESWLKDLKEFCEASGLSVCAQRLSEIIEDGNAAMKYYHFF